MTKNPYKEYEDRLEREIKELESGLVGCGSSWDERQRQISDLKHQLWQSRL